MRKIKSLVAIMIVLPFLLSLDPSVYDSHYIAKYTSPEGILFLSYSKEWNADKLQGLYHELLKNRHGDEIDLLQEVRVRGGSLIHSPYTNGRFNVLTNTIDLYHGDILTEPKSFSQTLSHEYGHLFTYHYLPYFHFPFSTWAKLRKINNEPIQWDAFWNYSRTFHDWFPEEIIAEDYVLLYGPTHKVRLKDVFSNEAFYLRTQHGNQDLSNVLENKDLQEYLEKKTGIKIEQYRFLQTPKLDKVINNTLVFSVTKRKNIAYRLNLTYYENTNGTFHERDSDEILKITDNKGGKISYPLRNYLKEHHYPTNGYIKANIDVLDVNTSLGFQTKPFDIKFKGKYFQGLTVFNRQ